MTDRTWTDRPTGHAAITAQLTTVRGIAMRDDDDYDDDDDEGAVEWRDRPLLIRAILLIVGPIYSVNTELREPPSTRKSWVSVSVSFRAQ